MTQRLLPDCAPEKRQVDLRIRILMPVPQRGSDLRVCTVPDCHEKTRGGKPYCPEHVALNPYASSVLRRLRGQDSPGGPHA